MSITLNDLRMRLNQIRESAPHIIGNLQVTPLGHASDRCQLVRAPDIETPPMSFLQVLAWFNGYVTALHDVHDVAGDISRLQELGYLPKGTK
jgi:hypothetical protein